MSTSKVWFVTGASKGFGREFVVAALRRGDKVAATARDTDTLTDLVEEYGDAVLPLRLDVTDRDEVHAAVTSAHEAFGRLDVVINNAGYGLFGTVEEITTQQLRDQLETNLFGVFHVTQAVLPILREQGSGHIIQISTIGGIAAFPTLGGYHASKWALEGLTESLAQEVAGFGIKVTLVEPGGFDTDWSSASATVADAQPQYAPIHDAMTKMAGGPSPKPVGFGTAIIKVVDAEKAPLRVFFGEQPTQIAPHIYQQRLDEWAELGSGLPRGRGQVGPTRTNGGGQSPVRHPPRPRRPAPRLHPTSFASAARSFAAGTEGALSGEMDDEQEVSGANELRVVGIVAVHTGLQQAPASVPDEWSYRNAVASRLQERTGSN